MFRQISSYDTIVNAKCTLEYDENSNGAFPYKILDVESAQLKLNGELRPVHDLKKNPYVENFDDYFFICWASNCGSEFATSTEPTVEKAYKFYLELRNSEYFDNCKNEKLCDVMPKIKFYDLFVEKQTVSINLSDERYIRLTPIKKSKVLTKEE